MWISFLQNISLQISIYIIRFFKNKISSIMGRNSRRNSSEKKQAREKNTKENREKLDDAEHVIVEDSEPSSQVDLSNTKFDQHSLKENWDDVDPNDTDSQREQPNPANETPKDVHENDKTVEESNKASRRKRKKTKQTNNLQDHYDPAMELEADKNPDEILSTQSNAESKSTEDCDEAIFRKPKKKRKSKKNHRDHDREMECQENKIFDDVASTKPNTESNSTEECDDGHSKKQKRKKRSKKDRQDNDREKVCQENKPLDDVPSTKPNIESNSTEECNELHSEKSKKIDKPRNKNQDHDREVESQENKIPNDVPSTQSNNEKKSPEEWNDVPSKKSKKRKKSKKNDQDHDREMEWQNNETDDRSNNENELPKDSKKHRSEKNRDDSSNRKEKSRERDREHSTHRRNKSHKKDRDDSSRRKDKSRERDREDSTQRGNESRKKIRDDSSHRKDQSQKDESFSSHQNSHSLKRDKNSSRRKDEPQQRGDFSKKDDFHDRNFRNDQRRYNQRSDQDSSEDSYNRQKNIRNYQDGRKDYNAGPSNKRNDNYPNENSYHQNRGKYEPPHRRQGLTRFGQTNHATNAEQQTYYQKTDYQNRNFRQNQENFTTPWEKNTYGRSSNNANNFQMSGQFKKKSNKQPLFVVNAEHYEPTIREIEGNLFDASEEYSLGHCVAEDLCMGAGIAVEFKKRFRGVNDLWNQDKRTGEVAILKRGNRFIFYLITKVRSNGKPTIDSLTKSIQSLKKHCLELNVKKLAIPRIGCGLDRLDWNEVKDILYNEFNSTGIEIVVYVL